MADRAVKVSLKADVSDFNRGMLGAAATAKAFNASLDTSTDRAVNFTQTLLAVGPALVPIGAAAIPALSGLTNQLAFAAAGAGVAVVAFAGVGDALDAVNAYSIEPTTANFQKMQASLETLGPAGQDFVRFLQDLRPEMQQLQNAAQAGLFPGMEAGITDLMDLLPQAERIVSEVATAMGDLFAEAGDNLNDPRWREFFEFLEREARPTLIDMGRTIGNFAEGFANLWMAFDPLSDQFSSSFLQMSRDFAAWTDGLSDTEGFQDFLDYVGRVGPKAWDALGAIGNALLQLVEAAAPVGEVALPVIEALADAIATVADSPIGPAAIGLLSLVSAYSRLVAVSNSANVKNIGSLFGATAFGGIGRAAKDLPAASRAYLDFGAALDKTGKQTGGFVSSTARLGTALGGAGKIAAGAAGLAFVMSDLDDQMGLSNTAMLALAGSMLGPWGAAVGGGIGLAKDFAAANDEVWAAVQQADSVIADSSSSYEQQVAAIDAATTKIEEYRAGLEEVSLFDLGNIKNDIEGLFGRSDDQELASAAGRLADARDKAARAAQNAMFAEAGIAGAMADASRATRDQTQALLESINAHNAHADTVNANLNAEIAFEQALDAAANAARKGKDGLDINTQAGRDNMQMLGQISSTWNKLDTDARNVEGAFDRTRASFVKSAQGMGATRYEAEKLADSMLALPTDVTTDLNASDNASAKVKTVAQRMQSLEREKVNTKLNATDNASGKIRTVAQRLQSLDGDTATVKIITQQITQRITQLLPFVRKRADGGYITGPGGPRDDRVPAWLSNGEFVVNAAATKRNIGLLHQINAQKYAEGGQVPLPVVASSPIAPSAPATAAAYSPAEFERALNRVFDNRKFDASLNRDGRTLQLTMNRG